MELELEMGPGCSRCKVHLQVRGQGAFRCFPLLSTCDQHGGFAGAKGAEELTLTLILTAAKPAQPARDCQPVPPRSNRGQSRCVPNQPLFRTPPFAAWNESKLQRKHTAAFHDQLPRPASTISFHCFSARSPRLAVTSPHPPPEGWVSW
jgi:hypothetical protein